MNNLNIKLRGPDASRYPTGDLHLTTPKTTALRFQKSGELRARPISFPNQLQKIRKRQQNRERVPVLAPGNNHQIQLWLPGNALHLYIHHLLPLTARSAIFQNERSAIDSSIFVPANPSSSSVCCSSLSWLLPPSSPTQFTSSRPHKVL